MISGESVELKGFVGLASMSAAAGYKLRARNMTALGVHVIRTVLNKTVSTGDNFRGLPWADLPPSLQVYGIGDIIFRYICYSVLAGIILRDLFPEPEIVCKTLKMEQHGAVSWILEWIMKSLDGVELHQSADEKVSSQAEPLAALRFRDSRNMIERTPPLIFSPGLNYWEIGRQL